METRTIKIERETFERNGKTYFGYFVGGEVRGRAVKAGVRPPDNGGYACSTFSLTAQWRRISR